MAKRRTTLLLAVSAMLVFLLGIGIYAGYQWQAFKREQGIVALEFHGWRLSTDGLFLQHISLTRQTADERLVLNIDGLQLRLDAWWRPLPLRSLTIDHLQADWQPEAHPDQHIDDDTPLSLPGPRQLERWVVWIPRQGHVASLDFSLPCTSGTCREQGQLHWQHAGEQPLPAETRLQLRRNSHDLVLLANAYEEGADTHLDLQLQLDGQQRLSLLNRLTPHAGNTLWNGTLAMSELPEAPWLLEWLSDWLAYQPPTLPELPQQMRIGAAWALQLDPSNLLDTWKTLAGDLGLSAHLPMPWPVPAIGQLQGQLDLTARAERGVWLPTELAANLQLEPIADLLAALPPPLRPHRLGLVATPGPARESSSTLPLQIQLQAEGPAPATLHAQLLLDSAAPYGLAVEQGRLRLQGKNLPELGAKGLTVDLRFNGQASPQAATLGLTEGSRITLDSLASGPELSAEKLSLRLAGINIEANLADQQLRVNGAPLIETDLLRQPSLRPQGWRWNPTLNGDPQRITLDGPLTNDAGLSLTLALRHTWADTTTRLDARLPELFLRAGNPFAATLADWPQTLELNTGRMQAQARIELAGDAPPNATATLDARGLGGIFDRAEVSGLDSALRLSLQRNRLRLEIPELKVQQANPGFSFGPLLLRGEYTGDIQQLQQGRLAWSTADVQVMGGRLWLDPGAADLAAGEQRLSAHLRGLQLPLLLDAYPTEGLSGTGVIDGELQLQRSEQGLSIEQGSLQAREPGGILRFRSARIQALGQSNPAMRLVTEALDDFHYDLLTSDVRYASDGTLNLGLRLHGRNPALEGGRPVNLSVNLEEDIPALLTSLQLSDRVSETIQRRVQERLRPGHQETQ
ncbi:intermembrane phospholipid transport protein YdbH family protein [Stutzerimonas stutzeri]